MIETWGRILNLVQHRNVRISEHGYDELADDDIAIRDIMADIPRALIIEH